MNEEKRMKVPDPEDPKYWYDFLEHDFLREPYKFSSGFDAKKYIMDFRRWKNGLKQALSEASKADILKRKEFSSISEIINCACRLAVCEIVKLILGEEASE